MNFSITDLLSCASSTSSMILPKVVSSPTLWASICKVPLFKIVPAKTWSPTFFLTGKDSPVIVASSTKPSPTNTRPSTGTFDPVFTNKRSSFSTNSMSTSSASPDSSTIKAVVGAIATKLLTDFRVFSIVRRSKYAPNKNKKVTIPDS